MEKDISSSWCKYGWSSTAKLKQKNQLNAGYNQAANLHAHLLLRENGSCGALDLLFVNKIGNLSIILKRLGRPHLKRLVALSPPEVSLWPRETWGGDCLEYYLSLLQMNHITTKSRRCHFHRRFWGLSEHDSWLDTLITGWRYSCSF